MPSLDLQKGALSRFLRLELEQTELSAVLVQITAASLSCSSTSLMAATGSFLSCRLFALYQKDMLLCYDLVEPCLALVVSKPSRLLALPAVEASKPNEP
jgi:hypothetical protein